MSKINRRQFMKKSLALGASISAFPAVITSTSRAEMINKVVVHPNVDNLKVVGLTDEAMTTVHKPNAPWILQNKLAIKETVWENIDKLASSLTETSNPTQAWKSIFIKPTDKTWSETIVAIKTNNLGKQHTRSAVMAKICYTLTDVLGVKPTNIHIYDACHGRTMSKRSKFVGLPEGCSIQNKWGGSSSLTSIPSPWKNGRQKAKCLEHLVNDSVDILINIAMCKGHSQRFGGFTMTMKNHFGTFDPDPGHDEGSQDYLIAINQTKEILGKMEKHTHKVLFPRQQLCLIDALWASQGGPGGFSTHQPNFLAMGVLSPIVDYQVATKFRHEKMGWPLNMQMTNRMLNDFGYHKGDLPFGAKLIEI
jgi:hypothetical protein